MKTIPETLLTDEAKCPICGVTNLVWSDAVKLAEHFDQKIDSITPRGYVYDIGGNKIAIGSACWDAPFGDECGACNAVVINDETAMIGPNGMCHA